MNVIEIRSNQETNEKKNITSLLVARNTSVNIFFFLTLSWEFTKSVHFVNVTRDPGTIS